MSFHITRSGEPARCNAKKRACPLGGTHYDSMEEASLASFDHFLASEYEASTQANAAHWDQNIGEVEALFDTPRKTSYDEDIAGTPGHPDGPARMEERVRWFVEGLDSLPYEDRSGAVVRYATAKHITLEEQVELRAQLYRYSDRLSDVLDEEAAMPGYRAAWVQRQRDDREAARAATPDPVALDDDIADLLDEWDKEEEVLRYQVEVDRELNPVTEDELQAFQTAEDEAAAIVAKASKGVNLDREASVKAAEELQSYRGMKTLDLLAADLADQAHEDFAAGKITQEELEEAVHVAGALRFLLSPSEGRRHTAREARPIDPELIQALRCLYMKRFGVDPFEEGVSVPQLLQMRQQRLI